MNSLLLASAEDTLNGLTIIGIVAVAVVAVFAGLSLFASIWKLVLASRYRRYNKQNVAANMTGAQVATKMLEGLGLSDVKVEKIGWIRGMIFGNSYSPRKKTIRLRKNIFDKASLTSVALAAQKVAIAQRHHEGDKKVAARATLMGVCYFAPFAVLPLVLVGLVLDFVIYQGIGWLSLAFTVLAFAFYLTSFVVVILNLKIEKKACKTAMEYMQKINLLTEDELQDAQILYKTYITDYWLQFWTELLYIIWEAIKLVWRIFKFSRTKD